MRTRMGKNAGSAYRLLRRGVRRVLILAVVLAAVARGVQAARAATGYEKQPVLKASQLVPAALLKGARFQVDETVPTDGFLARFTIRSDFGTFEAHSRDMLQIRVAEMAALEQLESVSKTETFAKALGSAAVRPVNAAEQIITNPVETAKGVPGGVERFFGRVKRGTEHLWTAATASDKSSADRAEEVARRVGGVSRDALGYEQERRQLAKELKVDPYTTNPVLAAKLDEVAWVTFSARLGINAITTVLVPGSMAISGTSFANDLVWDTPTGELLRLNEQKLRDMGLGDKVVLAMTRNPWYSLSVLTAFVTTLDQLQGVRGRDAVTTLAASVTSEDQARSPRARAAGPLSSQLRWIMSPGRSAWQSSSGGPTSRRHRAACGWRGRCRPAPGASSRQQAGRSTRRCNGRRHGPRLGEGHATALADDCAPVPPSELRSARMRASLRMCVTVLRCRCRADALSLRKRVRVRAAGHVQAAGSPHPSPLPVGEGAKSESWQDRATL
jgi:hypothetical protein